MFNFSVKREALIKPLQLVTGVVERRQTIPILSHILLSAEKNTLTFIGSDTEIELHSSLQLEQSIKTLTEVTIPGRKFLEICRSLSEGSIVEFYEEKGRVIVTCGRSRFVMTSLVAQEFPRTQKQEPIMSFDISQFALRKLIEKTSFAIPQQDVRQYLNGLLFEIKDRSIKTLATDGHRLAMYSVVAPSLDDSFAQVIIPRKGVNELLRLLDNSEKSSALVNINFNSNMVQVRSDSFVLISKLISGKFPNYNKIIPKKGDKAAEISSSELKNALNRVGILSNEVFRSVRIRLSNNLLVLVTSNPDQEEAKEELSVDYKGEDLEIVFNIKYLVDILNVTEAEKIFIFLEQCDTGVIIEEGNADSNCLYVVMPIRQ